MRTRAVSGRAWVLKFVPVLVSVLGALSPVLGATYSSWETAGPAQTASFLDMVWDGRQLVGVGWGGAICTSPDSDVWTERFHGGSDLSGIATNGSMYVAVGSSGIVTSPDAVTWTRRLLSDHFGAYGATWDGTRFVATGGSRAATSPDGLTWSVATVAGAQLRGVAGNGQVLVAVGYDAAHNGGGAWRSTDGLTWTQATVPATSMLLRVVWAGTRFVAVSTSGEVLASEDGLTWTLAAQVANLGCNALAWTGSQLVAVGGTIATSPDGTTWTFRDPGLPESRTYALAAVAWTGREIAVDGFLTSPDGVVWTDHGFLLNGLAGDGLRAVAVGTRGTVLTSDDEGATWVRRVAPTTADLALAGWDGAGFVAFAGDRTVLTSPDGVTWSAPRATGLDSDITQVAWTGDRWVAVLSDGRLAAGDAAGFMRLATAGGAVAAVTRAAGGLVAVGHAGLALTSPDGLAWTRRDTGVKADLTGVAWTGRELLAVGVGPTVLWSPDGVAWRVGTPPTVPTLSYQGCTELEKLDDASFDGDAAWASGEVTCCAGPGCHGVDYVLTATRPDAWLPTPTPAPSGPKTSLLLRTEGQLLLLDRGLVWRTPREPRRAVVPTAAHLPGLGGTFWRTDLEVVNRGAGAARYEVAFIPRTGTPPGTPARFVLQPGRTAHHADLVQAGLGVEGAGALRVRTLAGQLELTSRTYTDSGAGGFGQSVPAIAEAEAFRPGRPGRIAGLAQAAARTVGFRTNLGVVNVGEVPIQITIELHAPSGAMLGTLTETVPAGRLVQLNEVLRRVTTDAVEGAWARLDTVTSGGAFLAWASVIDNRTGDPVLLPAR